MDIDAIVKTTKKNYRENYPDRPLPFGAHAIIKALAEQMAFNLTDPDDTFYARKVAQMDNYDAYHFIRDELKGILEVRAYDAIYPNARWVGDDDADMIASLGVTIVKKTYDPCLSVMTNVFMRELRRNRDERA